MDYRYNLARTIIIQSLEELAGILTSLGMGSKQVQHLQERTERLTMDTFNLAVLGQYKRGKTTFINALLGQEVLPTAIVPPNLDCNYSSLW